MPYTSATAQQYKNHVTVAVARRVWAAVTATPQATLREIAARADTSYSVAGAALRLLRDAGYVDFDHGTDHGRRVIIPFVVRPFTTRRKDENQCLD